MLAAAGAIEVSDNAWRYCWEATKAYPFLEYAVKCILFHSDSAHSSGSLRVEAGAVFPYSLWRALYNLINPRIRLSAEVSPLYILVLMEAHNLTEAHINAQGMPRQLPTHVLPERHRSLLGAAVSNGDNRMVTMLLDRGIGANWPAQFGTCLSLAVARGRYRIARSLIEAGATVDPHANDPWGGSSLGQSLLHREGEDTTDIILVALTKNVYTTPWHKDFNDFIEYSSLAIGHLLLPRLEALVSALEVHGQLTPIEPYHELSFLAACMHDLPDLIAPLAKHGVGMDVSIGD
jgi:hypothetical protein